MFNHLTGGDKIVLSVKGMFLRGIKGVKQSHMVPRFLEHQREGRTRTGAEIQAMTRRPETIVQWGKKTTEEFTIAGIIRRVLVLVILGSLRFWGKELRGRHMNKMAVRAPVIITMPISMKMTACQRGLAQRAG